VPHERLLKKLVALGVDGKVSSWIREWLRGREQRVVIEGEETNLVNVTSGVPQGSILGPILFTVYINDIDEGLVSKILKFADDTKMARTVGNRENIQELRSDLEKLHQWSQDWQMPFNVSKCKVMHIGSRNSQAEYHLGAKKVSETAEEVDLGVLINNKFKFGSQCAKAASKANQILGMISRTFTYRGKDMILKLYKSLVRPHLEYNIQAWNPHLRKDVDCLEKVQRRATRMIEECKGKSYLERLKITRLTTLETRRLRADLLEVYKITRGLEGIKEEQLFHRKDEGNQVRTRGHRYKLFKTRFLRESGKNCFSNRIVNEWNDLPEEIVLAESVNIFKGKLERHFRNNRRLH